MPIIEQIDAATALVRQDSLVALLQDAAVGASIGFLPPLEEAEARAYWDATRREVAAGTRLLLIAPDADGVVGSM